MTPNFDEGTDKTHSIGVPDFVGEPTVRTNEPVLGELELSRAIRFGLFELLAEFDVPFNVKWTPEQEDAINRAEDELIALVRADDARRLRELSYDTEWIEDIASIRPSQLRDLADTLEGK
jgi:hypothetical protein